MTDKKINNKQRDQQITWLTQNLIALQKIFGLYVDYKGDDANFKKHLIDIQEMEKKKDDTKDNSKVVAEEG